MNMLRITLLLGVSLGFFVFVLHHTNMVESYANALGFTRFLRIREYSEWKKTNAVHNYFVFLKRSLPNFWTSLAACHYCFITFLSVFLCLGGSLFVGPSLLFFFLVVAAVGCLVYGVFSIIMKFSDH